MRTPLLLAALLLALVPPVATATESWGCHDYEVYVGDREDGAGLSTDDGAVAVAAQGVYVVSDGTSDRSVFSVWVYTETNGESGLQRDDPMCDETDGGAREPDCLLSCTF